MKGLHSLDNIVVGNIQMRDHSQILCTVNENTLGFHVIRQRVGVFSNVREHHICLHCFGVHLQAGNISNTPGQIPGIVMVHSKPVNMIFRSRVPSGSRSNGWGWMLPSTAAPPASYLKV